MIFSQRLEAKVDQEVYFDACDCAIQFENVPNVEKCCELEVALASSSSSIKNLENASFVIVIYF